MTPVLEGRRIVAYSGVSKWSFWCTEHEAGAHRPFGMCWWLTKYIDYPGSTHERGDCDIVPVVSPW